LSGYRVGLPVWPPLRQSRVNHGRLVAAHCTTSTLNHTLPKPHAFRNTGNPETEALCLYERFDTVAVCCNIARRQRRAFYSQSVTPGSTCEIYWWAHRSSRGQSKNPCGAQSPVRPGPARRRWLL